MTSNSSIARADARAPRELDPDRDAWAASCACMRRIRTARRSIARGRSRIELIDFAYGLTRLIYADKFKLKFELEH